MHITKQMKHPKSCWGSKFIIIVKFMEDLLLIMAYKRLSNLCMVKDFDLVYS